jgi:uncharacterized HAD superfamily protein
MKPIVKPVAKPTIAIDVDDVLAANAVGFLAYCNERWGCDLTVDDYSEDWPTMWGIEMDEAMRRADEFHASGAVSGYEHFEEAKEVLSYLSERYRLLVLTSRRQVIAGETLAWIDRYFPDTFDDVHFAGIWDTVAADRHLMTKSDVCKAIGADYLIDDQTKHCFAAADAGMEALLFGTYAWNRVDILPDNVVRVADWVAVKEYFDGRG